MKASTLRRRSLRYYWRTNLAVIGGVAIAVAVLAGALMVGVSVRASLRDLVLQRLGQGRSRGRVAGVLPRAARERVRAGRAADCRRRIRRAQESGRRASRVQVYAVDDRFWRFHGLDA